MSSTRRHSSSLLWIVALLVVGGLSVGLSAEQSLADVAKKENDRRETIKAPAKVYTNKDLQPAPSSTPPPAAAADKPADASKDANADANAKGDKTKDDKAKDGAKEPVKDKAYWAEKLKGLQQQLERDRGYATALQSRINSLTADAVNRDDPIQRSQLERDRVKAIAELDRLTKAVSDDQKAVADFFEDARRAAVPPGWLR
jgi:hypothetical protein